MDANKISSQIEKKVMAHVKEHQQHKKLTASEIGDLFNNYLGDSLFHCVFKHYLQVVEDDEIRDFIVFASDISKKHLNLIKEIYTKENIPVPVGFGEQDVRNGAPRLFSDLFMVFYIIEMSRVGLSKYGDSLSNASRYDLVDYFDMCIQDTIKTYKYGIYLLLSKGMDISPPHIPYPKKVDFVESKSFISLIAGKQRPVTALEIKHLQVNINTNTLGKALMTAFSQVASSDNLKKYFREGSSLAEGQIKELGELLMNEDLPTPKLMDTHVTDSTSSPFSDKLLMYHTVLSNAIGIKNYGSAISEILRHDLHFKFTKLAAGIGKYAKQGMNMMINHGWLEELPTAADRKKLSKKSDGSTRNEGS
ncbi:DUF3231 family protein [Halobacillus massiliensis]|uniref:DUF3231 family protein n=1 Tax=Halobacillus massiliensis TaxID=1926286 RepID=UPI0009E2BFB2|nr:DUF3231 family protein [Halobacillus massiliensis]